MKLQKRIYWKYILEKEYKSIEEFYFENKISWITKIKNTINK